ncbi:MAG: hypothetical protein ABW098_07255 [Candidatus Thiodiazotropha sp.]
MSSTQVLKKLLVIAVTAGLLVGCASNQTVNTEPDSQSVSQASEQNSTSDLETICNVIAYDLGESDHQSLYEKVDSDIILSRILDTFDEDSFSNQEFQKFKQRLDGLIRSKIILRSDKVRWDVVRSGVVNDRYTCLVRSSLLGGGVSYVEFELRNVDGRLRIVDWNDLVREVRMTDMFSELFHDIYEMADAHIMAMPYQVTTVVKQQKRYFEYLAAIRSGDPNQMLVAYDKLPLRFKNKPLYALALLNYITDMDDPRYYKVLSNIKKRFGGTGRYDFLLIDYYLLTHEYDSAKSSLDRFKKRIGEDPLLDLLLAELDNKQGNKQKFYAKCLQVMNNNPNYLDTYWYVFDQLVADGYYDDAVLVLNVLANLFEYTFYDDAFESDVKYREFTKSTAFKGWKAGSG